MAKVTRSFYTCDRCGVEMEHPVIGSERGPSRYTMSASVDMGVTGGAVLKWEDLCRECNSFVGETADKLAAEAKGLRAKRRATQ